MKKINLLMIALVGALTLTLTSCDECKDVNCDNGGTCAEGNCECTDTFYGDACEVECVNGTYADGTCGCDAGYEGPACTVESREQFFGTYTSSASIACDVTGSGTLSDLTTSFATSSVATERMLVDLEDLTLSATVDGTNFTIVEESIDTYTYTGNGSISGNVVSWTLNEYDPDFEETCIYTINSTLK